MALMTVNEVIQALMELGLSQSEIARQAGISKVTVYRLVHGKSKPTGPVVMALRRLLWRYAKADQEVRANLQSGDLYV